MMRAATTSTALALALACALATPARAQYAPAAPAAGRTAIDPLTARPGVTAPTAPAFDPVTGLSTAPRPARNAPIAPTTDSFGRPLARTGPGSPPPAIDPFTAQPGVQQMRPGTYDTYGAAPSSAPTPARPSFGAPGAYGVGSATPGAYGVGSATPGATYGVAPTGAARPNIDPYAGSSTDRYSYGRR